MSTLFARSLVSLIAALLVAPTVSAAEACANVMGRYHVAGEDHVVEVVLAALQSRERAPRSRAVALEGLTGGAVSVRVRGAGPAEWPASPSNWLREGNDFACVGSALQLKRPQHTDRWRDDNGEWYSGSAVINLTRHHDGGLSVEVTFEGGQRVTVYSYDSAQVSVPKPFSGRRFVKSMYWPQWFPSDDQAASPAPPEPAAIKDLLRRLENGLLGSVQMGTPRAAEGGLLVRFRAPRSQDVVAFEDRLRAAAIRCESRDAPIWSNNVYEMEFLIDTVSGRAGLRTLPSPLRVEHELRQWAHPLAHFVRLRADTDGYVATLRLERADALESLLARLRQHARLFSDIDLASAAPSSNLEVQLQLRAY